MALRMLGNNLLKSLWPRAAVPATGRVVSTGCLLPAPPASGQLDAKGAPVLNPSASPVPCPTLSTPFRCDIGVLDGAFINEFAGKLRPLGANLIPLAPGRGTPQEQLAHVDGLLIPGGADVHPSFYGEPVNGALVSPHGPGPTEAFKLATIRAAYAAATPMLGVCLGVQMMNVAAGGTLVQDMATQWTGAHGERGNHPGVHPLSLVGDSALRRVLGTDQLMVNSMHHEGIKALGQNLKITAVAFDGLPEGIEHANNPTQAGVQFHPEVMHDPRTDRIFAWLVDNAAAWRQRRLSTVA